MLKYVTFVKAKVTLTKSTSVKVFTYINLNVFIQHFSESVFIWWPIKSADWKTHYCGSDASRNLQTSNYSYQKSRVIKNYNICQQNVLEGKNKVAENGNTK